MTPEERRAQLAAELDTLLDAVVSIGPHSQRDADAGAPEGAFLAELELADMCSSTESGTAQR